MGLDVPDFTTKRDQMIAFAANRAPELATSPVDFLGELIGALAQMSQAQDESIVRASNDCPPGASSSTQGLDTWSAAIGLDSGVVGVYGRRGAAAASGATGQITGTGGTLIAAGTQATANGITISLRANVTTSAGVTGQVVGTFDAVTLGAASTLAAGTVCTWISPPAGIDSTFTLATRMAVAGRDQEENAPLLIRIQAKMQRPPNGGNGTDYAGWGTAALDANGNPVTVATVYAYLYPHYFGVGSPLLVILVAGSGTSRAASASLIAATSEFINGTTARSGTRPFSHDCTVQTGYMPAARALVLRVRCVPSLSRFAFDWVRGTSAITVNAFQTAGLPGWVTTAGGNAMLELAGPVVGTGTAPQTLKDAIDEGSEPRVYINMVDVGGVLEGPVIPEQSSAVGWQDVAGLTQLALRVVSPAEWNLTVSTGNEVYAGGPIVDAVAGEIQTSVDSRGPSRVSGLADPAVLWQDTISVTTLTTAAETALDTDELTRLVSRCVTSGSAADVTHIRIGGAGTPQTTDVRASDDTVSGPELLYAGRILVTD